MDEPATVAHVEPPPLCERRLADGTLVLIRPLIPSDEKQLRVGLEHLSPRARYQRFLTPTAHLSDAQIDYLVHPDGVDHLALVMGIRVEGESEPQGLAVARCIRETGGASDTAEVAVVVTDEWQGRGVGALLLRHLAAWAYRLGVRHWTGVVLGSNEAVKKAIDHVGPREATGVEGNGVMEITWRLDPAVFDV